MVKNYKKLMIILILLFIPQYNFYAMRGVSSPASDFFSLGEKSDLEKLGDSLLLLVPLTGFAVNFYLKDDKKGLEQHIYSQLANIAMTGLLKLGFNQVKLYNYDFGLRPNGQRYNVPSGHTSVTFTSSFHLSKRYGFSFAAPFFLLSAFTAYTRIESNKHDFAAVLFGILIAYGASEWFTLKREKDNFKMVHGVDPGSYELGFKVKL